MVGRRCPSCAHFTFCGFATRRPRVKKAAEERLRKVSRSIVIGEGANFLLTEGKIARNSRLIIITRDEANPDRVDYNESVGHFGKRNQLAAALDKRILDGYYIFAGTTQAL